MGANLSVSDTMHLPSGSGSNQALTIPRNAEGPGDKRKGGDGKRAGLGNIDSDVEQFP